MAECLKWVGNFMIDEVWLSKKINDVIVDKDDQWRIKLFNDIISEIGENFKYKSTPCKTVFGNGADTEDVNDQTITYNSDSNNELTVSENSKTNETTSALIRNLKLGKTTDNCASLNDKEIIQLLNFGHLKQRDLEQKLSYDFLRAVSLRRSHFYETANISFQNLPFQQYDYSYVNGSCCENVIGYVPVPTGIVGPLLVNGRKCFVPMSTTEGALVASTNRGCRAVFESGGVTVRMYRDGMTRAPVVQFANVARTLEMKDFLDSSTGFEEIKAVFDSTSSFARLQRLETDITGRLLFIRFEAKTGDAMGMNMVSKGTNAALSYLKQKCPEMEVLSLSGNYCVDKKASAINWIKGRGKSVVAEAVISAAVVQTVLKTTVDALVRLGQAKLLIGSSMAGTIGGWNAHAANIVAAIFIATGQDVAQVVSSSMCLTTMEKTELDDLYISCSMRCLEVGTVGGGTILPAQNACLQMMGCVTATSVPGECAKHLAEIICSTVLAGELSLLAAQCSNDLVKSHIRLNRSTRCLMTSADSVCDSRHESSSVTHDNDQQKKVRVEISFRDHPAEKPVKFEMQCSNIL
ncbi:Hydroxymethylglutaryl-coenzyme A reductase family protein [Brugia malayi]|nr:Hydroxymethylglutaryl-coenzyme A reductase family protein [Brugia malayi]CDQ03477.1 BMA-HMGR-1, isoform f [Brugia malayi]VIO88506.1 Hydroxymethylglutaryl-coenzyme A reductase family protein [Brugia malayi]